MTLRRCAKCVHLLAADYKWSCNTHDLSFSSRLNVCYNSINDEALKRLADAVERNYALTDVYIWGNDTGREASKVRIQ